MMPIRCRISRCVPDLPGCSPLAYGQLSAKNGRSLSKISGAIQTSTQMPPTNAPACNDNQQGRWRRVGQRSQILKPCFHLYTVLPYTTGVEVRLAEGV